MFESLGHLQYLLNVWTNSVDTWTDIGTGTGIKIHYYNSHPNGHKTYVIGLTYYIVTCTVFNLITAHIPISAQSRNSVVFRLQPVYFFFTSL